ncbi:MAG: archaemetzincin family Zn-dependent metalloprotease [Bacteroidales bacterium]|nr:archaemetzincin family Zn-dependent metalloprotease [Bacteroidales bacterium]
MKKQSILLISFGHFENDFLAKIADHIASEFLLPVQFEENPLEVNEFYDPTRRQYDGNKILKKLNSLSLQGDTKTLGLFEVDLFIPVLTYIFGQAIFKGNTGIASLYRLKNEQYGMKPDEKLLFDRFEKVIIHELGHTFGLVHCYSPVCVMRSSTYVEDIDQKNKKLCMKCRTEIERLEL